MATADANTRSSLARGTPDRATPDGVGESPYPFRAMRGVGWWRPPSSPRVRCLSDSIGGTLLSSARTARRASPARGIFRTPRTGDCKAAREDDTGRMDYDDAQDIADAGRGHLLTADEAASVDWTAGTIPRRPLDDRSSSWAVPRRRRVDAPTARVVQVPRCYGCGATDGRTLLGAIFCHDCAPSGGAPC